MFSSVYQARRAPVVDKHQSGPSVSSFAVNNVYNWFVDQLQKIYPEKTPRTILQEYPNPMIVMIGGESTGKSATIENITKVPIFPTDSGICTRCPVKVTLIPETNESYSISFRGKTQRFSSDERNGLKRAVREIFTTVETTSPNGYTEEEVVIVIERPDVIRIDLVDLPGMVSYPPVAKTITSDLSLRYIRDPNSFILCIANATIPRLTSYEPIARIIDANACNRSIIVLTMADKLKPEDYDTHLIQRLLGESDELRQHPFSACCAVINRTHESANTLEQQVEIEQSWFGLKLIKVLREFGGPEQRKCADKIEANAGTLKLLQVVHTKFNEYIGQQWVPKTLIEIDRSIASLEQDVDRLGAPLTAENLPDFQSKYLTLFKSIYDQIFCEANVSSLFRDAKVEEITPTLLAQRITSWIIKWSIEQTITPEVLEAARLGHPNSLTQLVSPPYSLQRFSDFHGQLKLSLRKIVCSEISGALMTLSPVLLANQYIGEINANIRLLTKVLEHHIDQISISLTVGLKDDSAPQRKALLKTIQQHKEVKARLTKFQGGKPK